ncbi:glucose PTS transporter subunit EIIB, partial [Vibrio sp. 10N.261.55.A7]
MSKIARQDVARLIQLVGGSDNIASVSHCLTRLRFVLNDTEKADTAALEALSLVKGCFTNAGQFQVVIGTEVDEVYAILIDLSGKSEASKDESKLAARQNMNILERGISHLAEIFVPLLPAIITGGLILGFRN